MLLLSPFVEAGSVNETYYNHFSMLLSIEEFFGLPAIGYAASGGVRPSKAPFSTSAPSPDRGFATGSPASLIGLLGRCDPDRL